MARMSTTFPFRSPAPIWHADRSDLTFIARLATAALGDGHGMIVERGLRQPPSYHDPRLEDAPIGHFFDVMTNGFGAMYSYASRVPVDDRWRIAAYIRALQLSQDAPPELAQNSGGSKPGGAPGGRQ